MVESPSSSEVCGQYMEHLLYSPSHSQSATISFTYGRIVSSLFKGTALFLSVTTRVSHPNQPEWLGVRSPSFNFL